MRRPHLQTGWTEFQIEHFNDVSAVKLAGDLQRNPRHQNAMAAINSHIYCDGEKSRVSTVTFHWVTFEEKMNFSKLSKPPQKPR